MSIETYQAKDYKSELKPIWCPGCGDFGVVQAIYRALAAHRPRRRTRSRSSPASAARAAFPATRPPTASTACTAARCRSRRASSSRIPSCWCWCAGGDGDGFSIGGGHVPHAIRRNLDLTYIVMDNQIYGLTKGQLSPTSPRGLNTASSVFGSLEEPVNPLLYVLAYGARFVAQGTPADMAGPCRR